MPSAPDTAAYAIDADGRIAWVDEGFAALAREHGQPQLADVNGQMFMDFIAGERPRELQRSLIATTSARELRYRCDSPEMRRHAKLRIEPQPSGGVVFTTWFEDVEKRPYQALLDPDGPRSGDTVGFCAWCNRIDVNGWQEIEDSATTPHIDHTVCEICELLLLTRPAAGPKWSGPSGPA